MTTNAGITYINIDREKYNRNRKVSSIKNVIDVSSVRPAATSASYAKRNSVPSRPSANYSAQIDIDSGITLKDILGYTTDAIGAKVAAKRREAARERANAPVYTRKVVSSKTAFPIGVLGYIIVFSAIAMFLVLGNTKINEATLRIDELNSAIAAEMNEGEILDSSLNARNDISYIEEYAVNTLGMVKSTDVAKTYVSISGEDKIVVNNTVITGGKNTVY